MNSSTFAHLQTFLAQHLAGEPTAGISLALTDRAQTLHITTLGYANLDAQTPVRPDHLFQIGSIGKSFTAIALLQLYEQGKLDLHAPVTHYLPWLEISSPYAPITLHHLLTHTAGIVTGTDESPTMSGEAWRLRFTPATCPPSQYFHYSNTGYKVLGLVLETLTGQPYAQIIRERILTPLGMTATEPVITHTHRARFAVGYEPFPGDRPIPRPFTDKTRLAAAPWFEVGTADGSIASTAGDMAIYLRTLLNHAAPLLRPETFHMMSTPHIQAFRDDTTKAYGYGLELRVQENRRQIGHGGGMVGYTSFVLGDVETGLGVAVLSNGSGESYPIADFALRTLIAAHENAPRPEIPTPRDYTRTENATDYAGTYHAAERSITLTAEPDRLFLSSADTTIPLTSRIPDIFHTPHPDFDRYFFHFTRNEQGTITGLIHGPHTYTRTGFPMSIPEPHPPAWEAYPGHYVAHNPWYPEFRIFLRQGKLLMADQMEGEETLYELTPGHFRIGDDERSPEWIRFEAIIDGKATQAVYSGTNYYRTFTE